jgi:diaminopimelate decarboxylase
VTIRSVTIFDVVRSVRTPSGADVASVAPRPVPDGRTDNDIAEAPGAATTNLADVRRWCVRYRKAFPWAGITCPAEAVRAPAAAAWVKKRGHAVDAHSCEELALAVSVGIRPARIILHDDGVTAAPLRCAVNVGAGRFIIGCPQQVAVLSSCARQPQRVLIDVTAGHAEDAVHAVVARRRLNLIGLHARVAPETDQADRYAELVEQMIAQMAQIRRDHDILLTRVSLAGGDALSAGAALPGRLRVLAAAIEDAFDAACARYYFPRPALVLAPVG